MLERRDDIDGLRAVAVTAVVIFHAFPKVPFGGFVGVDIFFVISGYLITSILYRALLAEKFSFKDFYSRRMRRIIPALFIVLIGSMAIAWFTLSFSEAQSLAKEVLAAVSFLSNFLYWSQVSYFDVSADQKPLLHLWSLAIEEQYYLLAPTILWASFRLRLNLITLACIGIIASFAVGIYLTRTNPVAAFYAPWSRAWELFTGGLLAFLTVRPPAFAKFEGAASDLLHQIFFTGEPVHTTSNLRVAASVVGAICIIVGFVVIRPGAPFFGWPALLPTVGTVCLIFAGPQTWLNRKVLSHPLMVWIGLISYPLYLWHWPLLSLAQISAVDPLSVTSRAAIVALSVVLATATYLLVEQPLRFRAKPRRAVVALVAVMVLVGGAAGSYFSVAVASPDRSADEVGLEMVVKLRDSGDQYGPAPCFKWKPDETYRIFIERGCLLRKWSEAKTVLLIGDSHSASLSLGLRPDLESRHINLLQISTGYCEPTSKNEHDQICVDINAVGERTVRDVRPDLVIIDSHWIAASSPSWFPDGGDFIEHLKTKLQRLKDLGAHQIVVVGQIPTWTPSLPDYLRKKYVSRGIAIPERATPDAESLRMDDLMGSVTYPPGVTYISLRKMLCENDKCLVRVGHDASDLIIWDYGHLTPKGARFVVQAINDRKSDMMSIRE